MSTDDRKTHAELARIKADDTLTHEELSELQQKEKQLEIKEAEEVSIQTRKSRNSIRAMRISLKLVMRHTKLGSRYYEQKLFPQ